MTLNSRGGDCSGYYRDEKGFLKYNGKFVGRKTKKDSTHARQQHTLFFIPIEESLLDQVPVVHDRNGNSCIGYWVRDHEAKLLRDITWKGERIVKYKGTNRTVHLTQGQPVSSKENIALLISGAMQYGARR